MTKENTKGKKKKKYTSPHLTKYKKPHIVEAADDTPSTPGTR